MKKLLQLIRYAVNLPLYWLCLFILTDRRLWVFGARQGTAYTENSRHLFEHVNLECPGIRAVWLTKNRAVMKKVRAAGSRCFMSGSIRGYWYTARAGAVFITHFNTQQYDLNFYVIKPDTPIIQLWHGSPMKKIIYDREGSGFNAFSGGITQRVLMKIFPFHRHKFNPDAVISASPLVARTLASAFRLPDERVIITGYPRNDTLLRMARPGTEGRPKKILCAPTFRENGRDIGLFTGYGFDFNALNSFCAVRNIEFHIRLHPYSIEQIKFLRDRIDRSNPGQDHILLNNEDDIYNTLGRFDMLITDYSSLVFDYLLLDRPVIFIPFDIESYTGNEFEFYHEYQDITPGPRAGDWGQVMQHIDSFLENPGLFSSDRKEVSGIFNHFRDSGSSGRIIDAVLSMTGDRGIGDSMHPCRQIKGPDRG